MFMEKFFKKTLGLWLSAGLCCFLWGSAFPAIKTGYRLLNISSSDTASIILFAGIRFTIAGILTVVIFSFINKRILLPSKSSVKKIVVLSLFQTVLQYVFFYLGLAFTTGARGSVIGASGMFFALLISSLVFRLEKLRLNKIIGSLIGFAGVMLISLDAFENSGGGFKGEFFVLLSSLAYAFSSVFMSIYSKDDNPAMLSGYQFILGGAVMSAFAFAFGGRLSGFTAASVLLIIYMALLSAVAYSLWSILLKYNEVSRVAVCSVMTPVFGFFLSALAEKNGGSISLLSLAALILAASGIFIVNYKRHE